MQYDENAEKYGYEGEMTPLKCDELKSCKGDVTIPVYGTIADADVYLKKDADAAIAELKLRISDLEKLNHDLCERVTENDDIRLHWEDVEQTRAENAKMNGYIHHLEEELEASKRKEKESRELADPYTLYCEASADALRKALGEYRWHSPCDDLPPEWNCVIVYFIDEEGEAQYRLAVYSKENGWEVDDEEVYRTAEIEAWHPLPMPPKEDYK